MGCDVKAPCAAYLAKWFQSTHPHGVRPGLSLISSARNCFNPRTHMGCDEATRNYRFPSGVFQSTHPHGVRQHDAHDILFCLLFQSTHPHGVRRIEQFMGYRSFQFQSTHPHGVRPTSSHSCCRFGLCFNPRTHKGCDKKVIRG